MPTLDPGKEACIRFHPEIPDYHCQLKVADYFGSRKGNAHRGTQREQQPWRGPTRK